MDEVVCGCVIALGHRHEGFGRRDAEGRACKRLPREAVVDVECSHSPRLEHVFNHLVPFVDDRAVDCARRAHPLVHPVSLRPHGRIGP